MTIENLRRYVALAKPNVNILYFSREAHCEAVVKALPALLDVAEAVKRLDTVALNRWGQHWQEQWDNWDDAARDLRAAVKALEDL